MLGNCLIVIILSFMQSNQWASMVLLDDVVAKVISSLEGKPILLSVCMCLKFCVSKFYAICSDDSSLCEIDFSLFLIIDLSVAKFTDPLWEVRTWNVYVFKYAYINWCSVAVFLSWARQHILAADSNSNLRSANLRSANLRSANLRSVTFFQIHQQIFFCSVFKYADPSLNTRLYSNP